MIAGGGLAGLTLACDLALRGVRAVVLDEDDTVGVKGASSRGICYAQKSLEIFDRLGIYERIRAKGITWSVGRTFSGDDEVYTFNLQDDSVSEQPPFINLQQFYLEWFLVDRIRELDATDLRWKSRVTKVENEADAVRGRGRDAGRPLRARGRVVHRRHRRQQPHPRRHRASRSIRRAAPTAGASPTCASRSRSRPSAGPGSTRRSTRAAPSGSTSWPTTSGGSTTRWPRTATRRRSAGPRWPASGCAPSSGPDVEFEFVWIGPYQYRDHLLETFRVGRTALHRRLGARGLAVRRPRRQQRHPGRGQPRLEAGPGARRRGRRRAARQLPRRALSRRRPRTSPSAAAPRASWRRAAAPSTASAAPSAPWRGATSSPAGWPTPGGWRRPTSTRRRPGPGAARARCRTSPSTARP